MDIYNTEWFIQRAKKIHNNKWDYSLVKYANCKTKVEIICLLHGSFWQNPNNHLKGKGCPSCAKKYRSFLFSSNAELFINKAKLVHKDRDYDYSLVNYINNHIKVTISCPVHGRFYQTPGNHLFGQGCQKCGFRHRAKNQYDDTNKFIRKAKTLYGERFNYNKVNYINSKTKVTIICPIHGQFEQRPNNHLTGREIILSSVIARKTKFPYSLSHTIKGKT
jgi:hypothetical protein